MKSEGKPKLSLVPKSAIWGAAEALTYGMQKHGKYSFKENGFPYTDLADKVLRHMTEWLDGNDFDKETGFHQLHHAIADLAILIDVVNNNSHQDDRFKKKKEPYTLTYTPNILKDDSFLPSSNLITYESPVEGFKHTTHSIEYKPQQSFDNLDIDKMLKNINGNNKDDNSK